VSIAAAVRASTAALPRPARAAGTLLADLLDLHRDVRRGFLRGLDAADLTQVYAASVQHLGTPFGIYEDDPVGFVEDVLGENLWSKPREILDAIPDHRKIAVPSCFASSKSWSLAREVLHFVSVHPVGTARVVTLAPMWRQVSGIMWPEIRTAHSRAGLPGEVGNVQYKLRRGDGSWFIAAQGVVGNARNESTIQGLHSSHMLLLVDEAGGLPHGVGQNLHSLLTNDDTKIVAIGNPAADNEGSWFEEFCQQPNTKVVRISAADTPALSGEVTQRCRSCPREVPPHRLARHLLQRTFVEEVIQQYGQDSPYVQAKIDARFPKGGSWRILPSTWLDAAADAAEPDDDDHVRLCDLGMHGEDDPWAVRRGSWVRLGVDVAADGGDEMVVALLVGEDLATIRRVVSGVANESAVTVAGRVMEEIHRAARLASAIGSTQRVRVKVDTIGVGWGVTGVLKAWASEGLHDAEVVGVNVSESDDRVPPRREMTPYRQRDAMWINLRDLVEPVQGDDPRLRLRVDRKTVAQLSTPTYDVNMTGKVVVESKDSMRKRVPGLGSPDRAEAVLLAAYEPPPKKARRVRSRLVVP
jgi:hypothetical protein